MPWPFPDRGMQDGPGFIFCEKAAPSVLRRILSGAHSAGKDPDFRHHRTIPHARLGGQFAPQMRCKTLQYTKYFCGFAPFCGTNFRADPHALKHAVMPLLHRLRTTELCEALPREGFRAPDQRLGTPPHRFSRRSTSAVRSSVAPPWPALSSMSACVRSLGLSPSKAAKR